MARLKKKEPKGEPEKGGAEAFVRCARKNVGKQYVWGTAGPDTFDCSGLVAYCYRQATGKEVTRSSYDQIKLGRPVDRENLQPGDVVFWDTENNGTAGHVGIYGGGNEVVNALNASSGVKVSPLDGSYGGPYIGARRLDFGAAVVAPEPEPEPEPDPAPLSGDDLTFPEGNVKTKRPGRSDAFGIPWATVAKWNPWWGKYAAEAKLPHRYLMAVMSLVESNAKQCWSGDKTCPRSDVVAAGDSFGDGQAIGILQVKHKLWQDFMPEADLWTAEGNIRLASNLMAYFIKETGSWQNAIRQKYHPGTSAQGTTPQMYVDTIEALLKEASGTAVPTKPGPAMKAWAIPGLGTVNLPDTITVRTILTPVGVHRPGRVVTMTGSTWHETGNRGNGSGAIMHSNWQDGCTQGHPNGYVGVTVYIENRLIVVKIPLNENSIHSGDWRNNAHPSMEVCVNADRNAEQTEDTAMWWQAAILHARNQNAVEHLYPHRSGGCPAIRNAAGKWPEAERGVDERIAILKGGGTIPTDPTYAESSPVPKEWDGTDYVAPNGERFYALQRVFVTAKTTAARKWATKNAPKVRKDLAAGEAFLAHYMVQGEGGMWLVSQYGSRIFAGDCNPRLAVLVSGAWMGDVSPETQEAAEPIINDPSRGLSAETDVDETPMAKAEFMAQEG